MNLCKDCIHVEAGLWSDGSSHLCRRLPDSYSLITGRMVRIYCVQERASDNGCGREGRYFKPKDRNWPERVLDWFIGG